MTAFPREFAVEGLACYWRALPPDAGAQALASAWLRSKVDSPVADGLHRDLRGRPRLRSGDVGWSHSDGRLLIAHAAQGRVGVDVEAQARQADTLRIAHRYFAREEAVALEAMDEDARQAAFLRLWCAKEAVLKAHGGGIAFGLQRAVFDAGDGGVRLLACDPALGAVEDWRIHLLAPEPGFVAVLAWTPGILSP